MKIKTYSKKQMCRMYNISYKTFANWLKIAKINIDKKQRILTPLQVKECFEKLGLPEN